MGEKLKIRNYREKNFLSKKDFIFIDKNFYNSLKLIEKIGIIFYLNLLMKKKFILYFFF